MTIMTLELPDELATQILPVQQYLPAILQLSITPFQASATQTAREIVHFLAQNPSPNDVLNYHVTERGQTHLRDLLARNQEAALLSGEEKELDELMTIEHIMRQVKIQAAQKLNQSKL